MNQSSSFVFRIAVAVAVVAAAVVGRSYLSDESETPVQDEESYAKPPFVDAAVSDGGHNVVVESAHGDDLTDPPLRSAPIPSGVRIQAILDSKENYARILAEEYPKALAGDADAQFLSYTLLQYCRTPVKMFKGMALSQALEALQAQTPAKVDQIETMFARCSDLFETGLESFGEWEEMRKRAIRQGQPLALIEEAASTWRFKKDVVAAQHLIENALLSSDPEAALVAGQLFGMTEMTEPSEALAWILAGCELGAVCGADSTRMTSQCEFNPECVLGEDLPTMVARLVGINPHDAELAAIRSQEIIHQLTNPDSTYLVVYWK